MVCPNSSIDCLFWLIHIIPLLLDEIRAELQEDEKVPGGGVSAALPVPKGDAQHIDVEGHFLPFELACRSKSARIVVTALDCIQVSSVCLFGIVYSFTLFWWF